MANYKYSTKDSVDFEELVRTMEGRQEPQVVPAKVVEPEEPKEEIGGGLIIDEEDDGGDIVSDYVPENVNVETMKADEDDYQGPGAIIAAEDYNKLKDSTKSKDFKVADVRPETVNSAKEYMKEQEAEIAVAKAKAEKVKAIKEKEDPQAVVNIYIDKSDVGKLVFTPEQQERLAYAQRINIIESSDMKFNTLKVKRNDGVDKDTKMKIIQKAFDRTLSPFIALGSGYMGKMGNCSVADIMGIGQHIDAGPSLTGELDRWSLLYKKMKYCSIGEFKDFDDFLRHTAYDDYENLQYALICASFPEKTTLEFSCPKCKKKYSVTVDNKSLLRVDKVNDEIADAVRDIVSADTFVERAQEVHENSLFNKITRTTLVEGDPTIWLELYSPSAYDVINRIYRELTNPDRDREEYTAYADLVKYIKTIYIATDTDDDGELVYTEFDEPNDIFDIIKNFSEAQLNRIATYLSESYMTHKYTYGIKEVVCDNPDCKHSLGEYPMSMDVLLFLKVRHQ